MKVPSFKVAAFHAQLLHVNSDVMANKISLHIICITYIIYICYEVVAPHGPKTRSAVPPRTQFLALSSLHQLATVSIDPL